MDSNKKILVLEYYLGLTILNLLFVCMASKHITTYVWVVKETPYTRLCSTKKILTVNGQFPGPAIYAYKGDTVKVNVQNQGTYNITIHWHGVKQPRNPWSDGPAYITQCPIRPGANFTYEIILSTEEGTMWWHAHSDWSRATVHGALIVLPKHGTTYPFHKPHAEFPIIMEIILSTEEGALWWHAYSDWCRATVHGALIVLPKHGTTYPFQKPHAKIPLIMASWFLGDVMEILQDALASGGEPNISDSFTINGQPGDLYPCSKQGTYKMMVDYGKTYLLRIINSVMNEEMFLRIADHNLTVVGQDGAYVKPLHTNYIMITPGQTMDILITANRPPSHYYLAARPYSVTDFDNTTTTAIFAYKGNYTAPSTPSLPDLPYYNDTGAATAFTKRLRALASPEHPVDVPKTVDTHIVMTVAMNVFRCRNNSCDGPNGSRLAASLNNISYQETSIDLLLAYYRKIRGVYETDFPSHPLYAYNYTADDLPDNVLVPLAGTKVFVLEFNSSVEIVFQGTNGLDSPENHPMHLHGYSFYFVGAGFGNFDNETDPKSYNLVDPPEINTVGLPISGWAAIRFRADNPGVWTLHCHLERHLSWGMNMAIIVKNGKSLLTSMRRPPSYLNPC